MAWKDVFIWEDYTCPFSVQEVDISRISAFSALSGKISVRQGVVTAEGAHRMLLVSCSLAARSLLTAGRAGTSQWH